MRVKVRSQGNGLDTTVHLVRDDGTEEEITAHVVSVKFEQVGPTLPVVTLGFALVDYEGVGNGALERVDMEAALRIMRRMEPLPEMPEECDSLAERTAAAFVRAGQEE